MTTKQRATTVALRVFLCDIDDSKEYVDSFENDPEKMIREYRNQGQLWEPIEGLDDWSIIDNINAVRDDILRIVIDEENSVTPACLTQYTQVGLSADWCNRAWLVRGNRETGIVIVEDTRPIAYLVISYSRSEDSNDTVVVLYAGTAQDCLDYLRVGK